MLWKKPFPVYISQQTDFKLMMLLHEKQISVKTILVKSYWQLYFLESMGDNHSAIQSSVKALDEVLPQVFSLCLKGGENPANKLQRGSWTAGKYLKVSFILSTKENYDTGNANSLTVLLQ